MTIKDVENALETVERGLAEARGLVAEITERLYAGGGVIILFSVLDNIHRI